LVDVEGHGREEIIEGIDLSRTVGWFTTIYPVKVESREEEAATETLKRVKEEVRRIPNRGIGYGVLKYLRAGEQTRGEMRRLAQAEISFNYLGQTDQVMEQGGWLRLAHESAGESGSPAGKQAYLIEVNAIVEGGKLRVDWSYSRNIYQRSTIDAFAEAFKDALVELIAHCQSDEARGHLPSDFPYSGLGQKELDDFISEISEFAD
jgi:non-ribosomal peptide synthase protein (TIGR01720 family)